MRASQKHLRPRWLYGVAAISFAAVLNAVLIRPVVAQPAGSTPPATLLRVPGLPELEQDLLVATSAQYDAGASARWGQLIARAVNLSEVRCLTAAGWSSSSTAYLLRRPKLRPIYADNVDYPDLQRLRRGQLDLPPASRSRPSPGPATGGSAAVQRAATACEAHPDPALSALATTLRPLYTTWNHDLVSLWTRPSVRLAERMWQGCVASAGAPASSPTAYFSQIDQIAQRSRRFAGSPYANPEIVARVRLYGHCVAPLASALDRARSQDLRTIEHRDRALFRALRSELIAALREPQ